MKHIPFNVNMCSYCLREKERIKGKMKREGAEKTSSKREKEIRGEMKKRIRCEEK